MSRVRANRMHGSTGGVGKGASYGSRYMAALGIPRGLSPIRLRHVSSPAPYPTAALDGRSTVCPMTSIWRASGDATRVQSFRPDPAGLSVGADAGRGRRRHGDLGGVCWRAACASIAVEECVHAREDVIEVNGRVRGQCGQNKVVLLGSMQSEHGGERLRGTHGAGAIRCGFDEKSGRL